MTTASTERVQAPAPASSSWWRRGLKPRLWVHAAAAFAVGAVAAMIVQSILPGLIFTFLLGGWVIALVVLAVTAFAFGWLGAAFLGRPGWWLCWTLVIWAPVTVVVYWTQMAADGGEWRGILLVPTLASGLGAALPTLLAYPGPPRIAALVISAAWVSIAIVTGPVADSIEQRAAQEAADAQWRADEQKRWEEYVGATPLPYRTWVDGYEYGGLGPGGESGLAAFLPDPTTPADQPTRFAITLRTQPGDVPLCGSPIFNGDGYAGLEPELSCEQAGDDWVRTSEHGHEITRLVGGLVVRAGGDRSVSLDELRMALDHAVPADQDEFDAVLDSLGVPEEYR